MDFKVQVQVLLLVSATLLQYSTSQQWLNSPWVGPTASSRRRQHTANANIRESEINQWNTMNPLQINSQPTPSSIPMVSLVNNGRFKASIPSVKKTHPQKHESSPFHSKIELNHRPPNTQNFRQISDRHDVPESMKDFAFLETPFETMTPISQLMRSTTIRPSQIPTPRASPEVKTSTTSMPLLKSEKPAKYLPRTTSKSDATNKTNSIQEHKDKRSTQEVFKYIPSFQRHHGVNPQGGTIYNSLYQTPAQGYGSTGLTPSFAPTSHFINTLPLNTFGNGIGTSPLAGIVSPFQLPSPFNPYYNLLQQPFNYYTQFPGYGSVLPPLYNSFYATGNPFALPPVSGLGWVPPTFIGDKLVVPNGNLNMATSPISGYPSATPGALNVNRTTEQFRPSIEFFGFNNFQQQHPEGKNTNTETTRQNLSPFQSAFAMSDFDANRDAAMGNMHTNANTRGPSFAGARPFFPGSTFQALQPTEFNQFHSNNLGQEIHQATRNRRPFEANENLNLFKQVPENNNQEQLFPFLRKLPDSPMPQEFQTPTPQTNNMPEHRGLPQETNIPTEQSTPRQEPSTSEEAKTPSQVLNPQAISKQHAAFNMNSSANLSTMTEKSLVTLKAERRIERPVKQSHKKKRKTAHGSKENYVLGLFYPHGGEFLRPRPAVKPLNIHLSHPDGEFGREISMNDPGLVHKLKSRQNLFNDFFIGGRPNPPLPFNTPQRPCMSPNGNLIPCFNNPNHDNHENFNFNNNGNGDMMLLDHNVELLNGGTFDHAKRPNEMGFQPSSWRPIPKLPWLHHDPIRTFVDFDSRKQ